MPYQQVLTAQHRACDAALVKIEQAAHGGDWSAASIAAQTFINDSETHFRFEEGTLFPALEATAPMAAGPISVMRSEHTQMRELFDELRNATSDHAAAALAEAVETLLMLMQQHNAKEENVLYPIADQTLSDDLLARLDE